MPKLRMHLDVNDAGDEEQKVRAFASVFANAMPYMADRMEVQAQHLAVAMVMELLIELEAQGHDNHVRRLIAGAQRMIDENDRGDATLQ